MGRLGQICLTAAVVHQWIRWAPMDSVNISETESRGWTRTGIERVSEMDVRFRDGTAPVPKGAIVHCDLVLPLPSVYKWYSYSILFIYTQHTYGPLIGYMFSTFQRFLNFYLYLICLWVYPRLGRSPGEGHGNPLQYSCLENPMDRGAWRATVHRGHKESDTTEQLTQTHTHTHTSFINPAYFSCSL